jgi:CRP/FNR family cyclic AMP-dependent transcriptional regulator
MRHTKTPVFDAQAFLDSAGVARKVVEFRRNATIFTQGDSSKHVMYIRIGGAKLSVVNEFGKEAVVAMLGPGDFFGEGCLAGQKVRMGTATAITPTTVLAIERDEMIRVLHGEHEFSDRFIKYMLSRNIRIEAVWFAKSLRPTLKGFLALRFFDCRLIPRQAKDARLKT